MDNDIEINVIVDGAKELQNLSVSLRRMLLAIHDTANATKILDARQRGLNQALGNTGRSLNDHAKNLRQVASNQSALSAEIKKTTQDLKMLQSVAARGQGGAGMGTLISDLKKTEANLKRVKARAFASDLRGVGQEMKRLGKDAQFVGRSLIIGLTTPIVAFGRLGIQNFYAIDKALVRLEKLLNKNRNEFSELTKAVNEFSYEFGIAKELLLGVTGDFAELGINAEHVLTGLTNLTSQFTILGDMDVSAAQDLTQTLYLGSLRAMEMSGEATRLGSTLKIQEQAMKNVNAQMYIFNALENATALSMREIADTLPEVSAAGLVFGLNFTEMMALLAPMKAVGIDVSSAATGLKVSFQKLVNPTIKLQKELKQLQQDALAAGDVALAFDYENVIGAGIDSIQSLVDITDELMKSPAGGEGALKFYAQLFDDRQATRMLITMQDLANFQNGMLPDSAGKATRAQGELVAKINEHLAGSGLLIHDIQSLSEVTALANAKMAEGTNTMFLQTLNRDVTRAEIEAAKRARREFADYVVTQQKAGNDVIEQITSEAGKAMMISFAGSASAMQRAEDELQRAKDSVSMSIDRIKIAFKNLTSTFIEDLGPTIKSVADSFMSFVDKIQNMSPETRKLIAGVVAAVAAIGPLVFIFGQVRLAGGVMLESIMKLVPGLKTLSVSTIANSQKLLNLKNGLTMTGNTIVNTNSRFATFIATLASGDGPIAKMAGRFGELTGMLKSTETAAKDVMLAVDDVTKAGATSLKTATADMFKPVAEVADDGIDLLDPKVYKSKLEQYAKEAMGTLGFAGVGGQMVDVDIQGDIAKKSALAQSELFKGIQKGLKKKKIDIELDDLLRYQISPTGKIFDTLTGQWLAKDDAFAKSLGNLIRYHQQATGTIFNNEVSAIQGIEREARMSARRRNADIKSAQMQARHIAKERIAGEIFDIKHANAIELALEKQQQVALAAQQAKMPFYQKKRISVTDSGDFMRKGRVISQASADRIASGGVGSVIERTKLNMRQLTDLGKKPVLKLKDLATAPLRAFTGHVSASKNAVNQLIARKAAFGKAAPGVFMRASAGAMGFGRSVLSASRMLKILRLTLIGTGIGAIIFGFAAAVMFLVKNFDKIRTQAAPGLKALSNAFSALKRIGESLLKPFLDFFATLGGGGGGKGKSTVDGIANAFNKVAQFIEKAAVYVELFVNKFVVPLLYNALGAIMGVIKGIMQFIQGIIKLKDNWREGLKMMWNGMKKIGGAIIGFFLSAVIRPMAIGVFEVVKLIVKAFIAMAKAINTAVFAVVKFVVTIFVTMAKGIVNAIREAVKLYIRIQAQIAQSGIDVIDFILSAWALLPRGIGNAVEAGANIFADFIDGIVDAVRGTPLIGWLADQAGLVGAARSGADAIRNIGGAIGDAGRAVADFAAGLVDPIRGTVSELESGLLGTVDSIADGINGFLDSIPGAIGSAADAVNSYLDSIPETVDSMGDWVAGLLEGFNQSDQIGRGAGEQLVENVGDEVEEGLPDALDDPFIDAGGEAGAAGGEAAGKAMLEKIAEIVQDLKQKFVDLVLDSVKGALDEATDQLQEALEKQKEEALKVYDTQIKTIEALEKAEESLTREKEYQTNRRRLIDERELQRANYQRNRALAIYEGRIDDARVMSLEDQKNQKDFQENLVKTDEDRRKDLVKENLDYLKESIKNAKEETEKMLDEQVKAFEKAAKEITKFPPLTIEEYSAQLNQLNDAAKKIAGENGSILQTMMTQMKDKLKMPNDNVGVFATGLDELVRVAQQKYGLTATAADNTIVGATIGMLAGINGQIVGNRSTINASFAGIVDDVFNTASTFSRISTEIIDPALKDIEKIFQEKNPLKIFEQAFKDANKTILDEMRKTVGHVASAVGDIAKHLDEALIKLAIAQEKAKGGLDGGATGGGATDGSTPGSPNTPGIPGSTPPSPMPDLYTSAVSRAFNQGIGNFLKIEEKNYLRDFTIGALKRAKTEPGFGMSHYLTLKKNATTAIGRVALQLWEAATKTLGMTDLTNATASVASSGYQIIGQYKVPSGITQKYDSVLKKNRWYNINKNQYLPDPPTGPLPSGQLYQWNSTIGDPNYQKWTIVSRMFGGRIPRMNFGGIVPGFSSQGVPAILHGGEYIVNAKAVKNIGYAALEAMNGMRYASPGKMSMPSTTTVNETQNINIYVDTFVGEQQWFESMMKEYNLKVVPKNQKTAGLENRSISTYSGINRGL